MKQEKIRRFDTKGMPTSSLLPKRTKMNIDILKTNKKFRAILTHFRSSNPKTTSLKVMGGKQKSERLV